MAGEVLEFAIHGDTQCAGISDEIIHIEVAEFAFYRVKGTSFLRQLGTEVRVDEDARSLKFQLLFLPGKAKNSHLILEVEQFYQDGPWFVSGILPDSGRAVCPLNHQWG